MKTQSLLVAAVVVLGALLGWFVWPSPYRYEHMGASTLLVRVHRLTGQTEILYPGKGWVAPNDEALQ